MFIARLLALLITGLLLTACETGPDSPRGFSLPKGDIAKGEEVFTTLGCMSCHTIKGIENNSTQTLEKPVPLGGKVSRIKTYGELVTSVINPSHKIARSYSKEVATQPGQSPMPSFNDTMTVAQLVDLVTFLETNYQLIPYEPTNYGMYY
ncbi:c-type cytochrome [Oceanicoccus sagamiensis]|uniref:Cytochrome C n=1 Tax=Oceanicoccus sagamiensis TaxID=716816 RepID=A0A1X9NDL6_9GAMM|nr:cytochrome c [Oceanicoccus sagamiensis]ARN75154.1 cytochrome C [Oceanicoccus sagamiensis]